MAALQNVRKEATSVLKSQQADPTQPCFSASTSPSADPSPLTASATDYPCLVHKCGAISVVLIFLSDNGCRLQRGVLPLAGRYKWPPPVTVSNNSLFMLLQHI